MLLSSSWSIPRRRCALWFFKNAKKITIKKATATMKRKVIIVYVKVLVVLVGIDVSDSLRRSPLANSQRSPVQAAPFDHAITELLGKPT